MGPFPHDAPPPAISDANPMGTDGFEFVEFCHPRPSELDALFKKMGFSAVAKHKSKDVTLYRQDEKGAMLTLVDYHGWLPGFESPASALTKPAQCTGEPPYSREKPDGKVCVFCHLGVTRQR